MSRLACPVCDGTRIVRIHSRKATPVHQNVLAATPDAARACPRGDIDLVHCHTCGFVFNAAFDATLVSYSSDYQSSQTHSPAFQAYLDGLAVDLVERHSLRGKTVLEIGCGKGEFLSAVCARGGNVGIGFDPSYLPGRDPSPPNVSIRPEPYGPAHVGVPGDLVCARHLIEHIPAPIPLLAMVRRALDGRPEAVVFFETPRLEWILEQFAFWDLCYEHCSYFAMLVLRWLFERCGFTVTASRPAFGGQYQQLEARPATPRRKRGLDPRALARLTGHVVEFGTRVPAFQKQWRRRVAARARRGPCAVWGAGAKGVTFLNVLELDTDFVPIAVDVNPQKQGYYVPGTGQRVVPPMALCEYGVRSVFVMNPNYLGEIREHLRAEGLTPELIVVQP